MIIIALGFAGKAVALGMGIGALIACGRRREG
jgi:hypothetical protein